MTSVDAMCGIGALTRSRCADVREGYEMLFDMAEGLSVCGAVATAEEALDEVPLVAPDVVIVDISLPGMNGLSLVMHLRRSHPELRLLIISGHDEGTYAEPARLAGADGFVRKGDADAILESVRRVLDGQSFFPRLSRVRPETRPPV